MFKLAGQIDKEGKDLNQLKCIKDNPKQVLMGDNKVQDRWRDYFDQLFNSNKENSISDLHKSRAQYKREPNN